MFSTTLQLQLVRFKISSLKYQSTGQTGLHTTTST